EALHAVGQVRLGLRPAPDGQGPRHRHGPGQRHRRADAARRGSAPDLARRGREAARERRSHRDVSLPAARLVTLRPPALPRAAGRFAVYCGAQNSADIERRRPNRTWRRSQMTIKGKAYIVGAYEHPTRKARDKTVAQLHYECARGALADAGLTFDDVDGYFSARDAPGMGGVNMVDYMNLKVRHVDSTETGGSSYLIHVAHAAE